VGVGTYVFFKPKWWYIALGAGAAIAGASVYAFLKPSWGESTFVVSAIALAIACVLVLGVSVYVLARLWIDTLRERKRKREVK
jgi:LPS O-antigen subunit length determinant protein (WzzB/FepE family)